MPNEPQANGMHTVVDFVSTSTDSTPLIFNDRISNGKITLANCRTRPSPAGVQVVSPQTTIVVPAGPAFALDWQPPDSDRVQSTMIGRGRVMLYGAAVPVWKRWHTSPAIFVMALAPDYIESIREQLPRQDGVGELRTIVGLEDRVADDFMRLAAKELRDGGIHGPLFLEALATAFVVHLIQAYCGDQPAGRRIGGLAPIQLRRVADYIEARVERGESPTLRDLGTVAGLSAHHFGEAFKSATGLSPHKFIIERRIVRAMDLLREFDRTVAAVAIAVGFSSQSHLTTHFRRITGITPARFRRSLE